MADLLFPLRSPAKSRMGSPMSLPEKVVVPDVIAIGSGMAAAGAAEFMQDWIFRKSSFKYPNVEIDRGDPANEMYFLG